MYSKIKFSLLFLVLLVGIKNNFAASKDSVLVSITGKISNIMSTKLYVAVEGIESRVILDSSNLINGVFSFSFYKPSSSGFVYIIGNKEQFFNQLIIFTDISCKSIEFNCNGSHFIDSIQFVNNNTNTLLYQFFKLNKTYAYKLGYIKQCLKEYQLNDDFVQLNKKFFANNLKDYEYKVSRLISKLAQNFLLKDYIKLQQTMLLSFVNDKTFTNKIINI